MLPPSRILIYVSLWVPPGPASGMKWDSFLRDSYSQCRKACFQGFIASRVHVHQMSTKVRTGRNFSLPFPLYLHCPTVLTVRASYPFPILSTPWTMFFVPTIWLMFEMSAMIKVYKVEVLKRVISETNTLFAIGAPAFYKGKQTVSHHFISRIQGAMHTIFLALVGQ
ncbi:hypothetical protein FRB91_002154 [Serendipita sp. 411]|nr:hypothetical protein FRB91_002154 [Serendipita sp. 411]